MLDVNVRSAYKQDMDVGDAVARMRVQRGLSQQTLADMVGISRTQITRIESGGNTTQRVLERISSALDYPLLIDGRGAKSRKSA